MIPYINRSSDVILSSQLDAKDVNIREVIDEFRSPSPDDFDTLFEAFVMMAPGRVRITCKSARKLEIAENFGFVVRGLPATFKPISSFKWVNITRLSYGVPEEAIRAVLEPFGEIRLIKSEQYSNVYTGVRNVLMNIASDIPARLRIANHWCAVHYKGQKKICFSCHQEGHVSSECPNKKDKAPVDKPPQDLSMDPPPAGESATPVDLIPSTEVQDMDIPPTPVNVGASTSAVDGDTLQTSEGDKTSLPSTDPSVVDPVDQTAEKSAEVQGRQSSPVGETTDPSNHQCDLPKIQLPVPYTKRRQAKQRGGRKPVLRSRSRSPVKEGWRDRSPRGTELSTDELSSDIDDFSFDSDLATSLAKEIIRAENVPLPIDDDRDLMDPVTDKTILDPPSTQFTPNLPCDTQERQKFPLEPEDTQASEETSVIAQFFANFQTSLPSEGDSA